MIMSKTYIYIYISTNSPKWDVARKKDNIIKNTINYIFDLAYLLKYL